MEIGELAIVIFAYNRPDHLARCLQSLEANSGLSDVEIFIFIDGPKEGIIEGVHQKVLEVATQFNRRFAKCTVSSSPINLGLRNSVITALNGLFSSYKGLIVVEDDLILTNDFLFFMINGLARFRDDKLVGSISGFSESKFPPFIKTDLIAARRQSCWGWATWQDRWQSVSWNNEGLNEVDYKSDSFVLGSIGWDLRKIYEAQIAGGISSWAITFDAHAARNGWRSLQPRHTLVDNLGMDGSGTHFTQEISTSTRLIKSKLINNRRIERYKISYSYDLWLRLKHSWFHNKIKRIFRFIELRFGSTKQT